MRKLSFALIISLLFMMVLPLAALADSPQTPHSFYGSVRVRYGTHGTFGPAPAGTVITATISDIGESTGNITTTVAGWYGNLSGEIAPHLLVYKTVIVDGVPTPVTIPNGATITFYIDGQTANQTYLFTSEAITRLDLQATLPIPPTPTPTPRPTSTSTATATATPTATATATGGGGNATATATATPRHTATPTAVPVATLNLTVDFWDAANSGRGPMTSGGTLLSDVDANSSSGTVTISIPDGTSVTDAAGHPVTRIWVNESTDTPAVPSGYTFIKAFNFSPSGTHFNPAITLTIKYDTSLIPSGQTPVIAYYDASAGWQFITGATVNTAAGTITFSIDHFTTFAVMSHTVAHAATGGIPIWFWIVLVVLILVLLLIVWLLMQRRRRQA